MNPLSPHPLLYLITNRQTFRREPEFSDTAAWQEQLALIREAAAAGCQLIQVRERDLPARRLVEFVREAIRATRPYRARLLVNDRLDIALATGADGVHLRASSLPASEARRLVAKQGRSDFLIGASAHSLTEAQAAEAGGADFIVFGPIYDTPSKRPYGPPLGLERLAEVCRVVRIPILAIGGIHLNNFREVLRGGAVGIAAISLFADRDTLCGNIKTILAASLPSHQ